MKKPRLLLCRPMNGLNDMLCQIDKACRYAERFGRTVIVDTKCQSTDYFKDDFARYFVSRQPTLRLTTEGFVQLFDGVDVYPECVAGRVNSYAARFDEASRKYIEQGTGEPLTFDFEKDYSEPLLLHHSGGGEQAGAIPLAALGRMRLHDSIVDILLKRLRIIGPRYLAIHVRHSDYETDYRPGIESLGAAFKEPVFVATDSKEVLEFARSVFGSRNVYSFSTLPDEAGKPLHRMGDGAAAYRTNSDAIVDLLMLALATRFEVFKLASNEYGATYSGYSRLALQLRNFPFVLSRLISRSDWLLDRLLPVYR